MSAAIATVVATVVPAVATIPAAVLAAVDAMCHDGRGADDCGGSRNGCADHSAPGNSSWTQRHVTLLHS
jgi:hypothetical protein